MNCESKYWFSTSLYTLYTPVQELYISGINYQENGVLKTRFFFYSILLEPKNAQLYYDIQ